MFGLEIEEGIARLTLRRPKRRNAIPASKWLELAALLTEIGEAKVLILGGEAGGAFCAGADISEFRTFTHDPAAARRFRTEMRVALCALRDVPIPAIAVVEGACYGAGVALAMACDVRVAGPHARFAITPAKLGISYPQEDVHRLVSLVGPGQASRMLLSAEAIDAVEAARIGLVELVADDAAAAAGALAAAMAANDAQSLALLKSAVRLAGTGDSHDAEMDRAFDATFLSDGFRARLKAHERPRK